MRKKLLFILPIVLIFCALVFTKQPIVVNAEGEEITDILNKLNNKYNEIANQQFLNTTIGAVIGGLVATVVSLLPSLVNKGNIDKSLSIIGKVREVGNKVEESANDIKDKFDITSNKFEQALTMVEKTNQALSTMEVKLNEYVVRNDTLEHDNEQLKKALVYIISNSPSLVSNDITKKVNEMLGE